TDLPAAQKAFIWYPYDESPEFPLVGNGGGRTAMAGPVFYRDDFRRAARSFPAYYDKKLFIYEWMRGWIMAVTLDANGDYVSMERFMSRKFSNPIDMAFGPNGDLYVLEYGTGWFQGNDDARLLRIEYTAGNRAPVVAASVDKPAGPIPLKVALSSAGTADADGDSLRYRWTISRRDGTVLGNLSGANPTFTFDRAGAYTAALTVTDAAGARASAKVPVIAGNDPPRVDMDIVGGNRSFFFPGVPVRYAVRVTDREDGSLASGSIKADQVRVTAEYLPEGVLAGTSASAPKASPNAGRAAVEASDCLACHHVDSKSIGPAFTAVAKKYRGDSLGSARLVRKIRSGGSGVWGNVVMPPHPQLSEAQAGQIVAYVLSLGGPTSIMPSLPVSGEYTPPASPNGPAQGAVMLRAAYTDRGAHGLAGASAEKTLVLRAPTVTLATGELSPGVQRMKVPQMPVEMSMISRSGAHAKLAQVDLTGVSAVSVLANAPANFGAAGGVLEVRLDSATGPLQGTAEIPQVTGQSPAPVRSRVAMNAGAGLHDVYFVVRNDRAAVGQMLVILLTATFEHGGAGWGPR
ncbi:MAG: PKD domain-containing protein, partial [Gemmatimonadota bacterium]|nr:PKD domain-containing protein [Gemmatimonadota bacterium]